MSLFSHIARQQSWKSWDRELDGLQSLKILTGYLRKFAIPGQRIIIFKWKHDSGKAKRIYWKSFKLSMVGGCKINIQNVDCFSCWIASFGLGPPCPHIHPLCQYLQHVLTMDKVTCFAHWSAIWLALALAWWQEWCKERLREESKHWVYSCTSSTTMRRPFKGLSQLSQVCGSWAQSI